jgi:hypothetical protein
MSRTTREIKQETHTSITKLQTVATPPKLTAGQPRVVVAGTHGEAKQSRYYILLGSSYTI